MGDSLIDAPSLMLGKSKRCRKRKAVSWAFCAFLILCSHVLALTDDNASSQRLVPKPSFSVLCGVRRYVALPLRLRHGMHVNGAGRHIIPVRGSGTPDVSRASTGSDFCALLVQC